MDHSKTAATVIKALMETWDDIMARTRQLFPDESPEAQYQIAKSAMDTALSKVLAG